MSPGAWLCNWGFFSDAALLAKSAHHLPLSPSLSPIHNHIHTLARVQRHRERDIYLSEHKCPFILKQNILLIQFTEHSFQLLFSSSKVLASHLRKKLNFQMSSDMGFLLNQGFLLKSNAVNLTMYVLAKLYSKRFLPWHLLNAVTEIICQWFA